MSLRSRLWVTALAGALPLVVIPDPDPMHLLQGHGLSGMAEAGPGRGAGAGARGVGAAPARGAGGVGVGAAGVGAPGAAVARRNVVRTGVYVAALPAGCKTVEVNDAPLYYCGGTYYQALNGQYAVVTVQ